MMQTETQHLDATACYRALRARDARFDGRFFAGVQTTGIYCRPVCPARTPSAKNVRFFACAAAAAEAGFRPCLRCRPETSPGSSAWAGTTTTVARALRLIVAGALDADSVDELAARVGVGDRHLRRLFLQHLGTTPRALAQTRRLAFAKRLIDETSLPMSTIALASGFGSVRRFNFAVHAAYRRSPRQLRRTNRVKTRPTGSDIVLRLAFRPPYDWTALHRFLAARVVPGLESAGEGFFRRTLRLGNGHGLVEVRCVPGANHLLARIRLDDPSQLMAVVARLRRQFDLDAEPDLIARHLRQDPRLAQGLRRHAGVRLPGAACAFEATVRAILGQQVSVAAATRLANRLVELYGEPLRLENSGFEDLQRVFPSPQALANADLSRLPVPRARAAAIQSLAAAFAADRIPLQPSALEEFVRPLCALRGVGEWTAHYAALRALGDPDAFPAGDLGLRRALGTNGHLATAARVSSVAESWRPWRAYAAIILWNEGTKNGHAQP